MSYSARIAVRSEVDGITLARSEQILTGRKAIGPARIHLRAGERSRTIEVAKPLPANASPGESYFIIKTDRPGVRARVSTNGTPSTVRANGLLLTGTEPRISQIQSGSVFPCFTEGGSWVNHPTGSASGFRQSQWVADTLRTAHYNGDSWTASRDSVTVHQAMYCWGFNDYVDLGLPNDGKLFQLWLYTNTKVNLTSCKLYFSSHPFGTDNTDANIVVADPTGGKVTDIDMVGDSVPGYYYVADVTSQLGQDRHSLVTVNKADFTAGGAGTPAPYWGRITGMRIIWTYSVAPGSLIVRGSSVYFGDPADSERNGITIIPRVLTDRTGVVVSLDAPPGEDANVTVMAVIS